MICVVRGCVSVPFSTLNNQNKLYVLSKTKQKTWWFTFNVFSLLTVNVFTTVRCSLPSSGQQYTLQLQLFSSHERNPSTDMWIHKSMDRWMYKPTSFSWGFQLHLMVFIHCAVLTTIFSTKDLLSMLAWWQSTV